MGLDRLVKNADYGFAGTYENLQASWRDARPIPTLAEIEAACFIAEENNTILTQIKEIEDTITQRRVREAVLGVDYGWLAGKEAAIKTLRGGLK